MMPLASARDSFACRHVDSAESLKAPAVVLSRLLDHSPDDIFPEARFQLVTSVIRKVEFNQHCARPQNPYEVSLQFGLERIYRETGGAQ